MPAVVDILCSEASGSGAEICGSSSAIAKSDSEREKEKARSQKEHVGSCALSFCLFPFPVLAAESKLVMSKGQLIDDIRAMNPTAQPAFLSQFDEESLRAYAERLRGAGERRRRIGGWSRKRPALRAAS
jgi:hypothetical protein